MLAPFLQEDFKGKENKLHYSFGFCTAKVCKEDFVTALFADIKVKLAQRPDNPKHKN